MATCARCKFASAFVISLLSLCFVARAEWASGQTQEPAAANAEEAAADKQDLSQRFRFLERYSPNEEPPRPELLVQYQVGFRESVKLTREVPQGAPERTEVSSQGIYTERVAKLAKGATVAEVVRRYDKFNIKTTQPMPRYKTKLLEGLNFLLRVQPHSLLQVICLTEKRQLRRQEYILVTQEAFLPAMASILPLKPAPLATPGLCRETRPRLFLAKSRARITMI